MADDPVGVRRRNVCTAWYLIRVAHRGDRRSRNHARAGEPVGVRVAEHAGKLLVSDPGWGPVGAPPGQHVEDLLPPRCGRHLRPARRRELGKSSGVGTKNTGSVIITRSACLPSTGGTSSPCPVVGHVVAFDQGPGRWRSGRAGTRSPVNCSAALWRRREVRLEPAGRPDADGVHRPGVRRDRSR